MNVLMVSAHHDDLEISCGATAAKLIDDGHSVTSLVMTHSGYSAPDGTVVRAKEAALREATRASAVLGYQLTTGNGDTFDIVEDDANVRTILTIIKEKAIDTVFTHWHGDTHPPHQRVHRMAVHAARHVPRVLGFTTNWYMGAESFAPRFFVGVSEAQWQRKITALQCYEGEYRRTGEKWVAYLNNQSLNFGVQAGVPRAEGFVVYKYVW